MDIVKLAPGEWEKYKEFRLNASQEDSMAWGMTFGEESELSNEWWIEQLEKAEREDGVWLFFAIVNGEIVGMVGASRIKRLRMNHIAHLHSVSVKKDFRGQGIARKLVEKLLEEIKKNQEIFIVQLGAVSTQVAAIALYKKLGFDIAGIRKKVFRHGEKFYDEVLMEKMLR